jgi:hypothetical protein
VFTDPPATADETDLVLEIFKSLGSGNAIKDVPVRFRTKDGRIKHLLIGRERARAIARERARDSERERAITIARAREEEREG